MKLDEIQFLKSTAAREGLFVVGERDFPASRNHLFLSVFQRLLSVFLRIVEKYFSTKSFIPAGGNGFSGYWKTFSFAQSFSSKWKPLAKSMEANFKRTTIF